MTDHRREASGGNGRPVPRDMPDQQAGTSEDPWEAAQTEARGTAPSASGADEDVPDTDEAGTGRRGAPQTGAVHPEQPVPDEPAD
ncbi:hypothetical protein [Streptomyces sp. NPDC046985]|uniref:hypothetical protein n=1 Tax=Streptomyces sp. NPDC046985 TaxID=3155377 RepID=UPI0033F21ACB